MKRSMDCPYHNLKTGDQGQRYEVRARRREDNVVDVIGWTDNDPLRLVNATKAWPRYADAWFVDRKPEKSKEKGAKP